MTNLAPAAPQGRAPDPSPGKIEAALHYLAGRPLVYVFAAIPLAIVLLLLGVIVYVSFLENLNDGLRGALTLRHFEALTGDPLIYSALWNTAGFTLVTVITAMLLGGSIAWLDDGGALRTGPMSAGASPGPAAYGRGGVRPTVTDAHVVLGTIAPGEWSGGVTISLERARAAVDTIAAPLGVSRERAADAIIATADATMARALRRVSVERGVDPRDVPLIAFGGGGPLHACGLAERLGMRQVIVPPHAGVLSAIGLALAPERRESLVSVMQQAEAMSASTLGALLEREANALRIDGDEALSLEVRWWLRARYAGQGYELDILVQPGDAPAAVAARFVARHEERTGFVLNRPVEFISARTTLSSAPWPVHFARPTRDGMLADDVDDGRAMARVIDGPTVVRLPDATMRIAQGWIARSLDIGGWMLEQQG